ncbi:MAG: NADH-quinone oxidoreductase subunit J [Anaerolineae bacterium]|nr:NADH-quinone oxidoreductase subunit J [Anaerolineae bacterium]
MITPGQVVFALFSIMALGAAVRVVICHRIFHGALWLIASFFGVAAIYLFLESPFMAGIQLFIYIGGVAVLTVIAIMVTKGIMREDRPTLNDPWSAGVVSVALFAVMVWMILQLPLPTEPTVPVLEEGLVLLGAALVDPAGYLLPFEIVSVMMLVVLIGSLYLGKER